MAGRVRVAGVTEARATAGGGLGPRPGEARHADIGRQVGDCGQLGDRHEVAAAEGPCGEGLGGMGEPVAVEAVPPGEESERGGDGMGPAPQAS